MKVNDIINAYKGGTFTLEEANKKLVAIDAGFTLNPYKNVITPQEENAGDDANGFGMLHDGSGTAEKVRIVNGALEFAYFDPASFGGGKLPVVHVKFKDKLYKIADDGKTLEEVNGK